MIRFQRPQLPPVEAIAQYYRQAEEARWFSNFGPCHELLVERLQARLPGLFVVPMANCTLGLLLTLRELVGRPAGDGPREVLVPSFTFAATAAVIEWAGLRPVFVDVDREHWMLDPAALEQALAERTGRVAAVLAASTFGAPPPVALSERWEALAAQAGVPLLVDSAAGFGALRADGRPAGYLGDAEVFSLHATKPFAIGEGGLVCTRDAALAERLRRASNFGFRDGDVPGDAGLNAKLPEWACATALAVLDGFDDTLAARRAIAARQLGRFAELGLETQRIDSQPAWQFVPALVPEAAQRDPVIATAARRGVELRSYFDRPLHRMPAFAGHSVSGELAVTDELAALAISLPMANDLSGAECDAVFDALRAALTREPT